MLFCYFKAIFERIKILKSPVKSYIGKQLNDKNNLGRINIYDFHSAS